MTTDDHGARGLGQDARADWSRPKPDTVPRPTFAPAAMAFGVTLSFFGLITSAVPLAVGCVIVVLALKLWIGEIRDEA